MLISTFQHRKIVEIHINVNQQKSILISIHNVKYHIKDKNDMYFQNKEEKLQVAELCIFTYT